MTSRIVVLVVLVVVTLILLTGYVPSYPWMVALGTVIIAVASAFE